MIDNDRKSREAEETARAIAEFIAAGGEIQYIDAGRSSRVEGAAPVNMWGAGRKKKTPDTAPAAADKKPRKKAAAADPE